MSVETHTSFYRHIQVGDAMKASEAKRAIRNQEMTATVKRCQESGLTVREWCTQNDIKEYTYYYWLKRIRENALQESGETLSINENQIIKVELSGKSENRKESIRLQLSGCTLNIPAGTDYSDISKVLKALREIC